MVGFLFIITNKDSEAQYQDCIDCDVTQMQHVQLWNFELPQFPGCSLMVDYWIYRCESEPDKEYIVSLSWGIVNNTCQDFIDFFVKKNPDGTPYIDWTAHDQLKHMLYDEVATQLFQQKNMQDYICGDNSYHTVTFKDAYCRAEQFIIYISQGPSGPQFGIRCWEYQPCDINGCCTYENEFCYDDVEDEIIMTPSSSVTGNCPPQTLPAFNCQPQPGDFVFTRPCTPICPTY